MPALVITALVGTHLSEVLVVAVMVDTVQAAMRRNTIPPVLESSGYFASIDGAGSYYGASIPDREWGSMNDGYYVDTGDDGYGTGSFMGYYGSYYYIEDSGHSGSGDTMPM